MERKNVGFCGSADPDDRRVTGSRLSSNSEARRQTNHEPPKSGSPKPKKTYSPPAFLCGNLGLSGYREPICSILAGEQQSNIVIRTWRLAYLVLHTGCRFRLGFRESERAHDFGGNYPNSPSDQLLHRIYDTRIAIWND